MNFRTLALTALTLAVLAPAAFAAGSGTSELCQYQTKNLKDTPAACETMDHGMSMHAAKVVTDGSSVSASNTLTFGSRNDVSAF